MRPAQHFNLIDVEKVERGCRNARVIDVIDIYADALLEPVAGQAKGYTDAADINGSVARVRRIDLQRRGELLQLHNIEIACGLDRIAPDDRDCDGDFLRRLLPTAGGDDDDIAAADIVIDLRSGRGGWSVVLHLGYGQFFGGGRGGAQREKERKG
ncbi:MAG: hypothetical protein U0987_06330 [Afipia sp.]|nr:hypothetical protein [Afipia sp.]